MWVCKNKSCEEYNKEVYIQNVDLPYLSKEKRMEVTTCKCCGEPLTFESPHEDDKGEVAIARFRSKSSEEKRKIIKDRADKHFKKFESDTVQEKKRQAYSSVAEQFN